MKRPFIEIAVLDYHLEPLPKARVMLLSRRSQSRAVLQFDRRTRAFIGERLDPGAYTATVEADGLAAEKREVEVAADGLRDRFILGREGMPAYYRGRVRVPFEPTQLVAASLIPQGKTARPEAFDSLAKELNLERANVSKSAESDLVAVFQLNQGAGEDERANVLRRLQKHRAVRHAGPVVGIIHDSVSFLTNELIVRFRDHVDEREAEQVALRFEAHVVRTIPYAGNAYLFRTAEETDFRVLRICDELVASGIVVYAEPNMVTTAVNDFHPNDTLLAQQTHHPIIGSEAAWDTTLGTDGVIVAVMDTGCDIGHPDFQNAPMAGWTKIYSPFDFVGMDADPTSDTHGTKSCGIAAANANNTTGVAGLASGCRLLPMRRPSGSASLAYSDAYIWAAGFDPHSATPGFPARITPGADVISSSFGFSEASLPGIMKDCFDYLTTYGRNGRGCVVVFSSGNDNSDFTTYRQWANYEKTIAVGSSTLTPPDAGSEHKASSSNFGSTLDLCAPAGGPGIAGESRSLSTTNVGVGSVQSGGNFDYDSFGQTSCACPQVSGTAALMLSAQPALTWVEVRQLLRDSATKIDFANADPVGQYTDSDGDGIADHSQWYGFGRLNAGAAVPAAAAYTFPRDIVVRDNLADMGDVATASPWWGSPDIWVRSSDPAVDGAAALPASYTDSPPDQEALANHDDNWIYVRYRNRGTEPSLDFYIRVYLMHWAGLEFQYPADFIPTTRPSDPLPSPLVPGTYLIGEVRRSGLAAGADDHVAIHWPQAMIPPATVMVDGSPVHWHPCLLVEITPHDGPSPTGVHVWDDNNLAQRNVTINYVDDDDISAAIVAGHHGRKQANLSIVIDRNRLSSIVELTVSSPDKRVMASLAALVARGTAVTKGLSLSKDERQTVIVLDRGIRQLRVPLPGGAGYVPVVIRGRRVRRGTVKESRITVTQFDGDRPTGAAAIEIRAKKP